MTNVLLLTVDDMNGDTPGCFGGPPGVTPAVDALAAAGMRFLRAHVNVAVCQPSRSVLLTGRYPHRNGAEGFGPIRADVPVLTDPLRAAGYRCGILGKVEHLAPVERFGWEHQVDAPDLSHGRSPARYAEEARRFLADASREGRPWFLMANAHDPHRPFSGSEQERHQLGEDLAAIPSPSRTFGLEECATPGFLPDLRDVRLEVAEYLSSCRRADDVVRAVLTEVEVAGATDDTLVVFLSDNGMSFPFAKSSCYLHGTRTPLVVRWPGVITAGSVEADGFVEGIDLAPTILDALDLPADHAADGRSFLPLLRGASQPGRDAVVTVFHETVYGRRYEMRAVQDAGYGYVWNEWSDGEASYLADNMMGRTWRAMVSAAEHDPAVADRCEHLLHRVPEELYDVRSDPDATHDLATDLDHADRLHRCRTQLRTWMRRVGDPLLGRYEQFLGGGPEEGRAGG